MSADASAASAAGYAMPADQVARMADIRRGVRKARKIRRVLERALGPAPWPASRVLDLGCGPGTVAAYFGRYAGSVVGVDVDAAALDAARRRFQRANLTFVLNREATLPFPAASFDAIILNHVYEHVADQAGFFREAARLLRPAGVAYLAAAGRWQLFEPHYGLPFLSWLPRRAANAYLRLAGRAEAYDVRLLSYRALGRLLAPFEVEEMTAAVIAEAGRYGATDVVRGPSWARRLYAAGARLVPALAPTRIFLLRKRGP